jgi:hypothetical protein
MTNTPDITPPPELVQQWYDKAFQNPTGAWSQQVAKAAAQWGADQELEACCHYFARDLRESLALELRAARRPKPPSLKEQALEQLRRVNAVLQFQTTGGETSAIRRALEALPND